MNDLEYLNSGCWHLICVSTCQPAPTLQGNFENDEKKLLIIEDEQSVAKQLRWGLDKEYDITIAPDTDQARPLLASGAFPVATLDLGLPPYPDTPQQGFALLSEISSLAPHTRMIVVTGNAEEENAIKAIALGRPIVGSSGKAVKVDRCVACSGFPLR